MFVGPSGGGPSPGIDKREGLMAIASPVRRWSYLFLAVSILTVPRFAGAQQSTGGAISGTVTDESGGALPAVAVSLRNQGTGVVRETETDGGGVYRALLLPVGIYEITAALEGFNTTRRTDVKVNIGENVTVDFSLGVASAAETITVTADA